MQYDMRGMRISIKVKFGTGSHVARNTQCAAHDDDLAHMLRDARLAAYCQSDVGERPDGDECNGSRCRHNLLDDDIYGMFAGGLPLWFRQQNFSQPVASMHIVSDDCLAHKRAIAPARYGDTGSSRQFEQGQGVTRGNVYMHIAAHGRNGLKLNFGRSQGQEQGQSVINARVGIKDNAVHRTSLCHQSPWLIINEMHPLPCA